MSTLFKRNVMRSGLNFSILRRNFTTKPNVEFFQKYRDIYENNQTLEKIFPRELKNAQEVKEYFNISDQRVLKLEDPVCIEAINSTIFRPPWKLMEGPGKRWRPVLGFVIAKLLKVDFENKEQLKVLMDVFSCIEFVHLGQLVLDDIADGSTFRREIPCLHVQYTIGTGLYSGLNLCGLSFKRLSQIRPDIAKKIQNEYEDCINLCVIGQAMKEYQSDDLNLPFYDNTSMLTSGATPRLIIGSLFRIYGGDEAVLNELISINDLMFLVHQIKDDIANIVPSFISRIKGIVGDDIGAGKYTPFVIHALKNSDKQSSKRLYDILKMKTRDQALLDEAIEIIKKSGGIAEGEKLMWKYYDNIVSRINHLKNTLDKSKYDLQGLDELQGYAYQLTAIDK